MAAASATLLELSGMDIRAEWSVFLTVAVHAVQALPLLVGSKILKSARLTKAVSLWTHSNLKDGLAIVASVVFVKFSSPLSKAGRRARWESTTLVPFLRLPPC